MQVIKIKASIPWVAVESTEGPWVAVCDSLGLTVQSDTWGELMEDIATALDLMLADLLEDGLLDQFLRAAWVDSSERDAKGSGGA